MTEAWNEAKKAEFLAEILGHPITGYRDQRYYCKCGLVAERYLLYEHHLDVIVLATVDLKEFKEALCQETA